MRIDGEKCYLAVMDMDSGVITQTDIYQVVECLNDEENTKFLGQSMNNHTLESQVNWIRLMNNDKLTRLFGIFNPDNVLVGSTRLDIDISVGIVSLWVSKHWWGQGIGTEAIELITDYGLNVLGLHRIEAGIIEGNQGSIRAFEKAGYKYEGTRKERRFCNGKFRDELMYARLD
jgi:ribosomal-protein-alanine N-acetyltransferase